MQNRNYLTDGQIRDAVDAAQMVEEYRAAYQPTRFRWLMQLAIGHGHPAECREVFERAVGIAPTVTRLRQLAAEAGLELEVDECCQCYRAAAPAGFCVEPGLHELVAVFGDGILGNNQTKEAARIDLADRLVGVQPEKCDCGDCNV